MKKPKKKKQKKMKNKFKILNLFSVSRFFFYLFFAFLPFQVDALLVTENIYFSGFFNPYLSHFIYISDVFLILSLLLLAISLVFSNKRDEIYKKFRDFNKYALIGAFILFGFYFMSVFFANEYWKNSLVHSIRVFEFIIVFFLVSIRFVEIKKLLYVFIGVISFTAVIGIFQYVLQESLGLRFFAEPLLSSDKLGIAKVGLFDRDVLRVYATFSHPNIFAGYLVFAVFFSIYLLRNYKVLFSFILIVLLLALLLTFSRSAILAFIVSLLVYFSISRIRPSFRYLILAITILLFFVMFFDLLPVLLNRLLFEDTSNLNERILYLSISEKMFYENVFGVGAGNFTAIMQDFTEVKLMPWLFQPVHNIFLLLTNEIGIQGIAMFLGFFFYLFAVLIKKIRKSSKLAENRFNRIILSLGIVILIIGLFDHYFISLYQGQALFWLWAGLVCIR
ncbi:MAG: hypothetical protein GF353_21355 [Candidatus Lokiarchaeota archaeon]|nr:hypothetical protein [Candidatus Lokiarchaeota archaeon]